MTFAHKVNRVTLSGTMFGGAEEWSTGFYLGEEGADADPATDAAASAVLALWETFFESATSKISNLYQTTQCKIALHNVDGKTDLGNVYYGFPASTISGAATAGHLPAQCALVVTLLSDRPRGRASKGRMYLPGIAEGVTATGKIATGSRDPIATNLQTFFNGVRAHADIPNTPILASKGTGAFSQLLAQNDYIQSIKVGDVIDTQRRRRNGLTESYITKVLV